ncbi:hypothetical protein SEA_POWERPUFF_38 [Arthrobacter phage Powerpuff]|nr:hypothetical protein SEA_POWERPUFF_38 [Arthrobacter phage Powerpuff]
MRKSPNVAYEKWGCWGRVGGVKTKRARELLAACGGGKEYGNWK